jgi:hypothetical protein
MKERIRKRISGCFLGALGFLAIITGCFIGGHNLFAPKKELPPEFFDPID